MMVQIRSALTTDDCTQALTLSTQLYNSQYSDDDVRMLYASAQACNVGIQLYTLIANIGSSDFSSAGSTFRVFVKLFPSTVSDSRLQSTWFAEDALQAILNQGAVVAPADLTYSTSFNPGSTVTTDRTADANIYMAFISMSILGTTLNRYGYNVTDNPAALGYHPTVALPWTTLAAVQSDTTGAACALASGMLNFVDSVGALVNAVTGTTSSSLNQAISYFTTALSDTPLSIACNATDGIPTAQCVTGADRLRFRGACTEQAASASVAALVIKAIVTGWN
jgi:hypothetical protein